MTKVKNITIERIEGNFEDCFTIIATSFDQAEQAIKMMSLTAPRSGEGYDKTDFLIEWEDGMKYQGRIDLQANMALKDNNLKEHIEGSMGYRIDQLSIPDDARITQEEYDEFIDEYIA